MGREMSYDTAKSLLLLVMTMVEGTVIGLSWIGTSPPDD